MGLDIHDDGYGYQIEKTQARRGEGMRGMIGDDLRCAYAQ
jgi:hypothetical protein